MRIVILVLCFVFIVIQALTAEEALDVPNEFDIPKESLDRLAVRDKALKIADFNVGRKELELEIELKKLSFMKLERMRLKEAFSAEFRLFLTSKGVPYDDLPNWQIKNNKAVRQPKKGEPSG